MPHRNTTLVVAATLLIAMVISLLRGQHCAEMFTSECAAPEAAQTGAAPQAAQPPVGSWRTLRGQAPLHEAHQHTHLLRIPCKGLH